MNVVVELNVKKLFNPQRNAADIIFHRAAVPQICTVWYSTLTGLIEYPRVDEDNAYSSIKLIWYGGQNNLLWWFRDEMPSAERRILSGGEHVVSEPFGSKPGDKILEQSINEANLQYKALKKAPANTIVTSLDQLSPIRPGFIRLVHVTVPTVAEKIKRTGLDYSSQGMITGTAQATTDVAQAIAKARKDRRYANGVAVVLEINGDEFRIHNNVTIAPGKIPPDKIIAIIPVS